MKRGDGDEVLKRTSERCWQSSSWDYTLNSWQCGRSVRRYAKIDYNRLCEAQNTRMLGETSGLSSTRVERMCILLSQKPCKKERARDGRR